MTQEEIREEYRKCVESFDYWKEHYLFRKRTIKDWQEIVYRMKDEFNIPLADALEMYKESRQKWVDWYNENCLK